MGNAGKVDFPDHMKNVHKDWLGTDDMSGTLEDVVGTSNSVVDLMVAAIGSSPYTAMTAYDPDTSLDDMDTVVAELNTSVDGLNYTADWGTAVDYVVAKADAEVFDDTYVNSDISAFGDELDDQIDNIVLPRFKSGMRDVNGAMTSAFVIGQAIIEGMRDRDVAKYGTDLRLKFNIQRNDFVLKGVDTALRNLIAEKELDKGYTHYALEAYRMRVVAEKEKKDSENNISVADGRWDLETYQYGGNILAAIGGGTMIPKDTSSGGPSKTQSGIGGALAGAAAGSLIGGPTGAVLGGIVGGLSGVL